MVWEGRYIAICTSGERIEELVRTIYDTEDGQYQSYLQDIDDERIAGFGSLDSDGSREVVDLREVEVLDIVGVVRVQYLHGVRMASRICQPEPDLQTSGQGTPRCSGVGTDLSACPFGAFHPEDLARFDGRECGDERVPSVATEVSRESHRPSQNSANSESIVGDVQ